MKTNYKPTDTQVEIAMELASEDAGFGLCLACGSDTDGVEPDARNRRCYVCDECAVFGAEEVILMGGF